MMMSHYSRSYYHVRKLNLGALTAALKQKSDPKSKEKSEINSFITIKKVFKFVV